MNKTKLLLRLIASPFIFMILLISYLYTFIKHFIAYLRYGGEFIAYEKDEPKRMKEIYELLKKTYET